MTAPHTPLKRVTSTSQRSKSTENQMREMVESLDKLGGLQRLGGTTYLEPEDVTLSKTFFIQLNSATFVSGGGYTDWYEVYDNGSGFWASPDGGLSSSGTCFAYELNSGVPNVFPLVCPAWLSANNSDVVFGLLGQNTAFSAAHVYISSGYISGQSTFFNNGWTYSFDQKRYDTDGYFNGSPQSQFLTAPATGTYEVGCQINYNNTASGMVSGTQQSFISYSGYFNADYYAKSGYCLCQMQTADFGDGTLISHNLNTVVQLNSGIGLSVNSISDYPHGNPYVSIYDVEFWMTRLDGGPVFANNNVTVGTSLLTGGTSGYFVYDNGSTVAEISPSNADSTMATAVGAAPDASIGG